MSYDPETCIAPFAHSVIMLSMLARSQHCYVSDEHEQGPLEVCTRLKGRNASPHCPARDSAPAPR